MILKLMQIETCEGSHLRMSTHLFISYLLPTNFSLHDIFVLQECENTSMFTEWKMGILALLFITLYLLRTFKFFLIPMSSIPNSSVWLSVSAPTHQTMNPLSFWVHSSPLTCVHLHQPPGNSPNSKIQHSLEYLGPFTFTFLIQHFT